MTPEELQKNEELFAACEKEIEERARKGENPGLVKLEVFKAHGVEIDEDALKAARVAAMPLNDEVLESVSGGEEVAWCDRDNNCSYVYHHNGGRGEWCYWTYECDNVYKCDVGLRYTRDDD